MKKIVATFLVSLIFGTLVLAQEDTAVYERRPFQMTFFFPPLSTNGANNANVVNDVSLNLFLGVSGGVEAFEGGLFMNIDRFHMHGGQLAGFGNVVGTDVIGAQGAGFVNVAGGNTTGAQLAGFVNVTGDTLTGFQGAGFVNVSGKSENGVQAAGFGNVVSKGHANFQGAGFFNVADEIEGAQAAGFVNVAGKVKGVQFAAFLNICDSIEGVPLALISVVKQNGYRKFSFSVSEVQYANLSYKMGVKNLYNIYSFGKPFGPASRWMFGGGLGAEIDLSDKMVLNIEGTVQQELWIANPSTPYFMYIDRLNLYNTLKVLFGWRVDDKVYLHVGPTFNVSVAHSNPDFGVLEWNQIPPYSFYNHTNTNYEQTNVQLWVGIQGSITF